MTITMLLANTVQAAENAGVRARQSRSDAVNAAVLP
jgi:hypothetical protein